MLPCWRAALLVPRTAFSVVPASGLRAIWPREASPIASKRPAHPDDERRCTEQSSEHGVLRHDQGLSLDWPG